MTCTKIMRGAPTYPNSCIECEVLPGGELHEDNVVLGADAGHAADLPQVSRVSATIQ